MPVAQSPANSINSSKGCPSITESFPLCYLLVLCATGAAFPVVEPYCFGIVIFIVFGFSSTKIWSARKPPKGANCSRTNTLMSGLCPIFSYLAVTWRPFSCLRAWALRSWPGQLPGVGREETRWTGRGRQWRKRRRRRQSERWIFSKLQPFHWFES
jgi:hypothetical protein